MSQLTIRGYDAKLERYLRELAKRERISLNQAAVRLMRRGAGLDQKGEVTKKIGDALDTFIGTWSAARAREVDEATRDFERVDPELWR